MNQNKENLTFSKRYGLVPFEIPFQTDCIDDTFRIELWNSFYMFIHSPLEEGTYNSSKEEYRLVYKQLWIHFFKNPLDDFPSDYQLSDYVRKYIQNEIWYNCYNLFEFVLIQIKDSNIYDFDKFLHYLDAILKRNNSGYRLINKQFVPVVNETEITEIETTKLISMEKGLNGILEHLKASLDLISLKPEPDCRNSIKESISMVEVISRIIEPSGNTLGKALKKLEDNQHINQNLKSAFEKLYAYTNNGGIRHALMEEEKVSIEDARFFLVSCSAFTNYLIEKASQAKII